MSNVVDILVRARDQTKGATDSASANVGSFGEKMKRANQVAVGASLAIGAGLLKVGADSIAVSRRMGELDAKSSAVFEGSLGSVEAWAEKNKKAFGTSAREVTGLAANFADLLKPMGFTAEQAAGMSTDVLDLSGALSKWSGGTKSAAEVAEILSAAMLGEREQLKGLGISISAADVQARLAKNGQEELTGAALEQAEAIATQQLIMEKSTDAQAAWAEGGRDAATAEGAFKSALAETQETVAGQLTPAIEKGTEILAQFSGWAQENQGTVMALGISLVSLAGAVLAVNAAVKVWRAGVVAYTAVQWALNAAMTANPIGLVIVAIGALVAAFVLLWNKSAAFRNFWIRIWNGIKSTAVSAKNVVVRAWNGALDFFRSVPGKIGRFFSGVGDMISRPFVSAFNWIRNLWNQTVGGFGFTIPSFIPVVGGQSFRIPHMAHGGIGGGLAMVGEHGRELVAAATRLVGDSQRNHRVHAVSREWGQPDQPALQLPALCRRSG